MTPTIIFLWLSLLQHFPPPPPPPNSFDLQSFIVTDPFGDDIDYGDRNRLFRRMVFGEQTLGDNLSGFCAVWDNIGGRITNLNRSNWRNVIRYVRDLGPQNCASGEVNLGIACDRARDEAGEVFNNARWCGGSYDLPIRVELILVLSLSFVIILFQRYYPYRKGF